MLKKGFILNLVHSIPKRRNYESFKIHSPYNWMACITIDLVCNILSLIPVIVLGLITPQSPTMLF
ncbi:hypothetical protein CN295_11890 [Bacillus cereus]|nr:hypothetical protein CN295_11890 [Bacillus cereus]